MSDENKQELTKDELNKGRNEWVHGSYLTEGTLVAFPLCFPGASKSIAPDESHITALDITAEGDVYGGTSGHRAHVFVGMFRGATGMVFDMGAIENSSGCVAVCCGESRFVAFVNGPEGGRMISRSLEPLPFDLLQEWWMSRPPLDDLGAIVPGEDVIHAVADRERHFAIGCTDGHLFRVAIETGKSEVIDEIDGRAKLAVGSKGNVFGRDRDNTLWRYDPTENKLTRQAMPLPQADWTPGPLVWAGDPVDGTLFVADASGRLFSFHEDRGFSASLGQAPLAPVTAMSVTHDGRLFGACGEGIGKIFTHDPRKQETRDLEVAVSVIQKRRYGYQFADAVTGRDGQILLGENDNSGHLWIYYPKIRERTEKDSPGV